MIASSLPAVLRERASLQPDDPAFTFMDYDRDWEGVADTVTWAQLYRRSVNLAQDIASCSAPGDRAVVIAPQSLDYVVAFLASMQAGLIAVPLSTPMVGAHDDRVEAVLADAAPTVILTTSAVVGDVAKYAQAERGATAPTVIEVDLLDLNSRRKGISSRRADGPETAYLQYTSGSTRTPAGVMVSHRNVSANFEQIMSTYFPDYGGMAPQGTTAVSWLPFYHDMGLLLGVCAPILAGWPTVVTSPLSFLARPARWMQLVAGSRLGLTAGPNFAFELAAARTSDADMAGFDLGEVVGMLSGAERVHPATVRRFAQRFAKFNLSENVIRPSYGLAEAMLFVSARGPGEPPKVVDFDAAQLSDGVATPAENGTPLVSYGVPYSPTVLIVDPDTGTECAAGTVGEIWVQGENICLGYWRKPEHTERTFGAKIASPSAGDPDGQWLRTGDLGAFHDGELYIMGRIKDLLIVRGRNHYPDDLEATIQEISGGRVAAISVEEDASEELVAIIEVKKRGDSADEVLARFHEVKREVTAAISNSHGLTVADLVLVPRGSIPITTSGKIRRAACAEQYRKRQFTRLDAEDR